MSLKKPSKPQSFGAKAQMFFILKIQSVFLEIGERSIYLCSHVISAAYSILHLNLHSCQW